MDLFQAVSNSIYLPLDESLPARKEAFACLYSDRMPSLPFAAMQ
jgi:hypothetical protein